jgi:HK97 gp10 family phage protein
MKIRAHIDGTGDLAEALKLVKKVAPEALEAAISDAAQIIKDEAQRRCPEKTGRLKRSIDVQVFKKGSVAVTAGAPYAKFVEYGTSKMAARPFMRPAADRGASKAAKQITAAVKRKVGK